MAAAENDAARMMVMARVRPFNARESSNKRAVRVTDSSTVRLEYGNRPETAYKFDAAFDDETSQAQVFENVAPFVDAVFEGYNCSIFTYGQTGTGKTHTMLGHDIWALAAECESMRASSRQLDRLEQDAGRRGLIPRAMEQIFMRVAEAEQGGAMFRVRVSYLEIYNEKIIDLLRDGAEEEDEAATAASALEVREDRQRGIFVPGATEASVTRLNQVLEVLWKGAKNRAMSATDMNAHSSRSHTIFTCFLEINQAGGSRFAKCTLVDLAGSEKWKTHQLTKFSAQRIKELTSINQSLSTLSNCVSALLQPGRKHVPYRNSKLTRMLQDSLGGNTRTMFIVTVSPSSASGDETLSTLQFATRAMRVQMFATTNETLDGKLLQRYENEIARLRALLRAATSGQKTELGAAVVGDGMDQTAALSGQMAADLESLRDENVRLLQEISKVRSELHSERTEKQLILDAVYGDGDTLSTSSFGSNPDDPSGVSLEDIQARTADPKMQMKVLQAQRAALDDRLEQLELNEAAQEDRWAWLEQYHTWLRTLPIQGAPGGQDAGGGLGRGRGEDQASVTLYDRLCMMETSVVMQSQELRRAKQLFLREKGELQSRLEEMSQRHHTVLRLKTKDRLMETPSTPSSRIPRRSVDFTPTASLHLAAPPRRADPATADPQSAHHQQLPEPPPSHPRQPAPGPASGGDVIVIHTNRSESERQRAQDTPLVAEMGGQRDQDQEQEQEWRQEQHATTHGPPRTRIQEQELELEENLADMTPADFLARLSMGEDRASEAAVAAAQMAMAEEAQLQASVSKPKKAKKKKKRKAKHVWSEHDDTTTGLKYYHNRVTKATTWERPPDFPGALVDPDTLQPVDAEPDPGDGGGAC